MEGAAPVNCAICGAAAATFHMEAGGRSLVRCRDCGLVSVADPPASVNIYSDDAYFTRKHDYVDRWDEFCALFRPLVGKIRRYKEGGTLLDVGAGIGALVHVAAETGFSARGVELSEWAASYARTEKGLDVLAGTLGGARFDDGAFDVVVINHVLEHVPDPKGLLGEARRILAPDGLLVVGVPNMGSLMARIAGPRWVSLQPDEHLWHFTPATLSRLLAATGFDILGREARESHPVTGFGPLDLARRAINLVAALADMGEAMLFFARKAPGEAV